MLKGEGFKWVGVVASCVLLSACAGQLVCEPEEVAVVPVVEEPVDRAPVVETPPPAPKPTDTFISNPTGPGRIAVGADGNPILPRVPFAYDDAGLNAASRSVLADHARLLRENPNQRVLVEGHCDERGTREYNLALGERRAMAVVDFFLANGVNANQVDSRSFGEEQPVDPGTTEAAFAKNRRVELKYY